MWKVALKRWMRYVARLHRQPKCTACFLMPDPLPACANKPKGSNRPLPGQSAHISACTRVTESSGKLGKRQEPRACHAQDVVAGVGVGVGVVQDTPFSSKPWGREQITAMLNSWMLLSCAPQLHSSKVDGCHAYLRCSQHCDPEAESISFGAESGLS